MNQEQPTIPLNEHLRKLYDEVVLKTDAAAIFFSSYESTENVLRSLAKADVRGKVVLGRYDGSYETSYTISIEHLAWLVGSGLVDGQESLMLVSHTGHGYLVFNQFDANNELRIEELGVVIEISKEDAEQRTAFTFDPEDGLYYGTTAKVA